MSILENKDLLAVENVTSLSLFSSPREDEELLTRGDVSMMNRLSPLQWATELLNQGQNVTVNPKPIEEADVGRFTMLALSSQALLCMSHMPFEKAVPIEYCGRILTVDFELMPRARIDLGSVPLDKNGRAMTIEEAEHARRSRVAKYVDDPPVPLLFAAPVFGKEVTAYYAMVGRVMQGYPVTHLNSNRVMVDLLNKLSGALSRSEALYFVVMVQSLVTGAYKQNFAVSNVISPNGHGYIDDIRG